MQSSHDCAVWLSLSAVSLTHSAVSLLVFLWPHAIFASCDREFMLLTDVVDSGGPFVALQSCLMSLCAVALALGLVFVELLTRIVALYTFNDRLLLFKLLLSYLFFLVAFLVLLTHHAGSS